MSVTESQVGWLIVSALMYSAGYLVGSWRARRRARLDTMEFNRELAKFLVRQQPSRRAELSPSEPLP